MSVSLTLEVRCEIPYTPSLLKGLGNISKDVGVDIRLWMQEGRPIWDFGSPSPQELIYSSREDERFIIITPEKQYLFLTQPGLVDITDNVGSVTKDIRALPVLDCQPFKFEYHFNTIDLMTTQPLNSDIQFWGIFGSLEAASIYQRKLEYEFKSCNVYGKIWVEDITFDPKEKHMALINTLFLPHLRAPRVEKVTVFYATCVGNLGEFPSAA